ncbi:MAG: RluA family pseudouridine synthase [Endomicrobium sp.]|jgi:23S rRNA pseudouridine955/2504/2580 synthase/23S rRNA pseudouridine1911/1915/1917 synthase|nr:RluA family pseudouridine synthase [Endomicrobium sp.]
MNKEIKILYQDTNIVVINKPAGLLVIPDQHTNVKETVVGILERQLNQKLWVVQKTDKDVTGVLVIAKSLQVYRDIRIQFENLQICRKYIALVSGVLDKDEGTINKPILVSDGTVSINIRGKESITNFKVLERFKSYTLIQVWPVTRRKHQVRIHLWSLGHPLAIDNEYGISEPILLSSFKRNYKMKNGETEKPLIKRLTLHIASLTLILSETGKEQSFAASLPKDFEITLKQLRKYGK